jgi:hypothetical protein
VAESEGGALERVAHSRVGVQVVALVRRHLFAQKGRQVFIVDNILQKQVFWLIRNFVCK